MVRNFIAALLFSVLGPVLTAPPPPLTSFSVPSVSLLFRPPARPVEFSAKLVFFPARTVLVAD